MNEPLTPEQRRIRSSLASLTRWSREPDRAAAMRPVQEGRMRRFERQVDPDGALDPKTRAQLAETAQRAHMARMALARSKNARRRAGR